MECSPTDCDIAEVRTQVEQLAKLMSESGFLSVTSQLFFFSNSSNSTRETLRAYTAINVEAVKEKKTKFVTFTESLA
jgi:DNA gyrase inhibitor GyrI